MQIFAGKIFENPIKIIEAFDNESFVEAFSQIELLRGKYYLLGYIRYEAKEIFLGNKIKSEYPLLYFEVFERCEDAKMQGCKEIRMSINSLISQEDYANAVERIKEEIACGNTYEVNYTYDYKVETDMCGFELYKSILPNQTTPYNAYIKNKYEEILSFSPEMFFELENNKIRTKPMKGTVKRGVNDDEDRANIEFLKKDVKNRAENVMIVDLLRNDLGKIAKTGTVKVDKLFEVETHKTVHQMTSEISAELEDKIALYEIFEAIFPCGSITGAPKINTMNIIDEIETGKREIYCGAIGLILPEKTVFSVPIRILQKKNEEKFFSCRVGGAIVWDSTSKEEWEETLTKIKFLKDHSSFNNANEIASVENFSNNRRKKSHNDAAAAGRAYLPDNKKSDFQLVETILVENGKMKYAEEHSKRMNKSAKELGFEVVKSKIRGGKKKINCILRCLLSKDGTLEIQQLALNEIKTNLVTISKIPVKSDEKLLYHKTTCRPWYDEAMEKIKAGEIFDEIFFNEKGELTEGARSNLVLQIDGELFTPPVACGLLEGILRGELLKQNKLTEKKLYLKNLAEAEKVFCINSVRGVVEVKIAQ